MLWYCDWAVIRRWSNSLKVVDRSHENKGRRLASCFGSRKASVNLNRCVSIKDLVIVDSGSTQLPLSPLCGLTELWYLSRRDDRSLAFPLRCLATRRPEKVLKKLGNFWEYVTKRLCFLQLTALALRKTEDYFCIECHNTGENRKCVCFPGAIVLFQSILFPATLHCQYEKISQT